MRDAIDKLFADRRLKRVRNELEPLVRWSVRLGVAQTDDDALALGTTKLGGRPDLPSGLEWPVYTPPRSDQQTPTTTTLPLVAQFRLSDIAPLDRSALLPPQGFL